VISYDGKALLVYDDPEHPIEIFARDGEGKRGARTASFALPRELAKLDPLHGEFVYVGHTIFARGETTLVLDDSGHMLASVPGGRVDVVDDSHVLVRVIEHVQTADPDHVEEHASRRGVLFEGGKQSKVTLDRDYAPVRFGAGAYAVVDRKLLVLDGKSLSARSLTRSRAAGSRTRRTSPSPANATSRHYRTSAWQPRACPGYDRRVRRVVLSAVALVLAACGRIDFDSEGLSLVRITPAAGTAAGGSITLVGTGFVSGTTATVNGLPCTTPARSSANAITCSTPPDSAIETVDVEVSTPDGSTAVLTGGFTYVGAPVLWLSASSGVTSVAGKVSSWADRSGNGNDAAQSTLLDQPIVTASDAAFGDQPTLAFGGSTDYMQLTNLTPYQNVAGGTWLLVASATALGSRTQDILSYSIGTSTTNSRFKACLNEVGNDVGIPTANGVVDLTVRRVDGDPVDFISGGKNVGLANNVAFLAAASVDYVARSAVMRVNRTQTTTSTTMGTGGNTTNTASAGAYIGNNSASEYFGGSLAEILAYNTTLTTAQIQVIEDYLAAQYKLP
jgi:hypothetical protein